MFERGHTHPYKRKQIPLAPPTPKSPLVRNSARREKQNAYEDEPRLKPVSRIAAKILRHMSEGESDREGYVIMNRLLLHPYAKAMGNSHVGNLPLGFALNGMGKGLI